MSYLKQKVRNLNGWQRIWFVCSVVFILWGGIVFPSEQTEKGSLGRYKYKWAVEKEIKNPSCLDYMSKDMKYLEVPDYSDDGKTCWHIYTHREMSLNGKKMNPDTYDENFSNEERKLFLTFSGIGLVFSFIASGLLYLIGWTVKWIVVGFKKKSDGTNSQT